MPPDLVKDRVVGAVDKLFWLWVVLGMAIPFALGWIVGGGIGTALTALLWGGLVRIFLLHHVTWSINSVCHFFGRKRFDVADESRNVFWLAPLSMGEAWHHNHHAFPTSAFHGLRFWERMADPTGLVIQLLEKLGLVWNVVRVSPDRQAAKLLPRRRRAAAPSARAASSSCSALFERRHRQAGVVEAQPVVLGVLARAAPDDRAAPVVDAIGHPVAVGERDAGHDTGQGLGHVVKGVVVVVEHEHAPVSPQPSTRLANARQLHGLSTSGSSIAPDSRPRRPLSALAALAPVPLVAGIKLLDRRRLLVGLGLLGAPVAQDLRLHGLDEELAVAALGEL